MHYQDICRLCLGYTSEYDSENIPITHIWKLKTFVPRDLLDIKYLKDHISCLTCLKSIETVLELVKQINKSNAFIYDACIKLRIKMLRFKHLKRFKNIPDNHILCRICLKILHIQNIGMYLFESPINTLPLKMIQNIMKEAKLVRVRLTRSDEDVICYECWENIQIAYAFKKGWNQVEKKIKSYCQVKKISPFFVNRDDLKNIVSMYNTCEKDAEIDEDNNMLTDIHIKTEVEQNDLNGIEGCEMIIKNEPYEDETITDQQFGNAEYESENDSPPELELQGLCVFNPVPLQKRFDFSHDFTMCPPTLEPEGIHDIKIQNVYSLQPKSNLMVKISKSDQEKAMRALQNNRGESSLQEQAQAEMENSMYILQQNGAKSVVKSKTLLLCKLCDYETFSLIVFQRHERRHRDNTIQLFNCPYCDFKSWKKTICDKHIKTHRHKQIIKRGAMNDFEDMPNLISYDEEDLSIKKGNIALSTSNDQRRFPDAADLNCHSKLKTSVASIGQVNNSSKKKNLFKTHKDINVIDKIIIEQPPKSLQNKSVSGTSKSNRTTRSSTQNYFINDTFESNRRHTRSKTRGEITNNQFKEAITNISTVGEESIGINLNPDLSEKELADDNNRYHKVVKRKTNSTSTIRETKFESPKKNIVSEEITKNDTGQFRQLSKFQSKTTKKLKTISKKLESAKLSQLHINSNRPSSVHEVSTAKNAKGFPIIKETVHYDKERNIEVMTFEVKRETLDKLDV